MRMRPMSLFETQHSNGQMSLHSLVHGTGGQTAGDGFSVANLASLIAIGGWPALQGRTEADAQLVLRSYVDDVARTDASRVDDKRRDPAGVRAVVDSLARNTATQVTTSRIAADAGGTDGPMREATVSEYMGVLERLMVIENQLAWGPHLRSRATARVAPKRHFVDPSLAVAAMGAASRRLVEDLNTLGFLFESLVIRDLRVYAQALDASVLHYRDSDDREVDAIVQAADGRWAAFEIKLGGDGAIDSGAKSLINFAKQIDTDRCGAPGALGVIVGTSGYGYLRPDGVAVIPIGALGP
jgi:predicted AAA+ superfamily ATPase